MSLPWKDRRLVITGSAVLLLVLAGTTFFLLPRPVKEAVAVDEPPAAEEDSPELREVQLYFPGDDGRLHATSRELAVSPQPTDNIARLVEALIAGPHGEHPREDGLWPPFPAGIALGRTYLLADATVILDLVSADRSELATGSKMEMLMLYSLVNTVLMNVDEAERVVVLWNGRQPSTFAGHVDATRPFVASNALVAAAGES